MRYFIAFSFVLISVNSVFSQFAELISFKETVYDFGTVKEEDGPVMHEFTFVNTSPNPLTIKNVKASCGCTTPAWTKETVAPGKSGFIQAQYNPANRPGPFNKSLTITTDAGDSPIRLYIKGTVTPKAKSIEEELPTEMGALRVKYKSFNLGKVYITDEPTVKAFEVFNSSDKLVSFTDKIDRPEYINLKFEPKQLQPKSGGVIKVIYDAKAVNDLGFMSHNVTFYTTETGENSEKSISVYATVLEYFTPLTKEELAKAPSLKITNDVHDFGKIKSGQKVTAKFELKNSGVNPLKIRKAMGNCSCLITNITSEELKAGQSTTLEVIFDTVGRKGNQQKSVTLYTNDPKMPVQRVTLKAYIESE